MCGIVGYTGEQAALPILLEALKRLEYRGYDSAGVVVLDGELTLHKAKGEIRELENVLPDLPGTLGIGHTRWRPLAAPAAFEAQLCWHIEPEQEERATPT